MYRFLIMLTCFGLLISCGTEQVSTSTHQTAPSVDKEAEHLPTTPADPIFTEIAEPGINYPPTPESVVQSFLSSAQIDPTGQLSLRYLVPALQQKVAEASLEALLNLQTNYEWFRVDPVINQTNHEAQAEAVLYTGPSEQHRIFILEESAGIWRISQIESQK